MLRVFRVIKKDESGNVLFLILIAVALFAALSYAVTSSTRSSEGDTSNGTSLISSAQITQYPSSVSTSIVRMVIAGTSLSDIRFNRPAEFSTLDSNDIGVFHPSGGGATYIPAPKDVMENDEAGQWVFNGELEVPDIGTSGTDGNEIIGFLVGLKKSICSKINLEHGIGTSIPILNADHSSEFTKRMYDDGVSDYVLPTVDVPDIDDGSGAFNGQPFGCFQNGGGKGEYVYYHVVVER